MKFKDCAKRKFTNVPTPENSSSEEEPPMEKGLPATTPAPPRFGAAYERFTSPKA